MQILWPMLVVLVYKVVAFVSPVTRRAVGTEPEKSVEVLPASLEAGTLEVIGENTSAPVRLLYSPGAARKGIRTPCLYCDQNKISMISRGMGAAYGPMVMWKGVSDYKWIPGPTACLKKLLLSSRCPVATIFARQVAKHNRGNIWHLFATLQVKKDFGSFSFFWGSKERESMMFYAFLIAIFTFSVHVAKPCGTFKASFWNLIV